MHLGDHAVEGVNTLEDHHFVLLQLDGLGWLLHTHPPGELILGHEHPLPPGEHGEVPVQQLHVHAQGRLQIQLALRGAGGVLVDGFEIVVHGHIVGAYPPPVQLLGDLHGGSGLAGAGRAGQQDDGAVGLVLNDHIGGLGHLAAIGFVALGHEGHRVRDGSEIDVIELVRHA